MITNHRTFAFDNNFVYVTTKTHLSLVLNAEKSMYTCSIQFDVLKDCTSFYQLFNLKTHTCIQCFYRRVEISSQNITKLFIRHLMGIGTCSTVCNQYLPIKGNLVFKLDGWREGTLSVIVKDQSSHLVYPIITIK